MAGFEDLLPGEIASKRKPGPAPMRAPAAGSTPTQQPPSAPAVVTSLPARPLSQSTSPGPADSSVDGVPDSKVDAWFQLADADGDGRVADSEARDFFLTSGLAPADLSKIWKLVKSPDVIAREGKGLSRHRFAQVLRLIALAQCSDYPFTQENAGAALHSNTWLDLHGVPLPPPRVGGLQAQQPAEGVDGQAAAEPAAPEQQQQPQQQQQPRPDSVGGAQGQADAADSASDASGAAGLLGGDLALSAGVAGSSGAAPAPYDYDDDDLFGLRALQVRAASHGASTSDEAAARAAALATDAAAAAAAEDTAAPSSGGMVRRMSRSIAVSDQNRIQRVHTGELEAPVAFEARLPPLQPKVSAKLTMLAAANGSLFAGPAVGGGLLQWGRPEGNMRRPLDVEGQHVRQGGKLSRLMSDLMYTYSSETNVATEDTDAAPAIEVHACDKGRASCCVLVDGAAQLLWVADKEGWVYAYDISGEPCMSLKAGHRAFQFQAHRVGYVTAMCRTPQGELWTGSSRGNMRVWELGEPALVGDTPEPPRSRELRKGFGERAHSGPVVALACPADGQLVWSASGKGVLLWDAACGAFLGMLQRSAPRFASQPSQAEMSPLAGVDVVALKYKIDGQKGLETDPITRYVVARPPSSDWPRITAEQEAWAAQTDNNINELMERVSIGGSKVVQGAGKAVKLLGKLARGLGGSAPAPAADAPKPSANRAPSSSSLAGAGSVPGPLTDDEAGYPHVSGMVGEIVTLVAPPGGGVWVAHKCGIVDRYTAAGQRLGSTDCGPAITAASCVGQRVWVGFADGMISVRDQEGGALRVFQAHAAAILSITQAGSRTYSLAADGSIKGWSSAVPHDADAHALASWDEQACTTFKRESLRVLCVTWNVGESKPEPGSPFFRWVHEAAFNTQLAVVGLQEIEMGSSSVALAAAKDAFSHKMQERGNTNAKFWSAGVLQALGGERHWHQVGLRQLSGMLVLVYARNHLRSSIGEVTTASVACGVLGVGGNKGAVAVEFSVHRRRIAVVCSHFAAHQGAVEARNSNYATICRQLTFSRRAWYAEEEAAAAAAATATPALAASKSKGPQGHYLGAAVFDDAADVDSDADSAAGFDPPAVPSPGATPVTEEVVQGEGMRDAEMLVWLGDFNYRIDGAYEAVKERAIRNELSPLLKLDQCRREMAFGRVFRGMREGCITFRPTYKFDKASANPFGYDTSEKRRIPAWCDRIFFRGTRPFPTPEALEGEGWAPLNEEDEVVVRALEYSCWADVTDSDHKPVYAVLEANLPVTNQAKKRGVCSQLLKECAAVALEGATDAAASLAPDHVKLHPSAMPRQMLLLRNDGSQPLLFAVSHGSGDTAAAAVAAAVARHGSEEEAAAVAAAHQLLEVRPVRGVVQPGKDQAIQVHLAGDEWALQGAEQAPEMSYRVCVGSEYSAGGEGNAPGSATLTFTATCLTHL